MLKKLVFFILFFLTGSLFAQDKRVAIEGLIKVPENQELSEIGIYNKNTLEGTTSNYLGQFFIKAKANDTLLITALQFNTKEVIISPKVIEEKYIIITLNTHISDLDEVFIYKKDFNKRLNLSYQALEYDYDFRNDRFTPITRNYAEEAQGLPHLKNGLNILNILLLVGKAIFKKKKNIYTPEKLKYQDVVTFLSENYDTNFYYTTFEIPKAQVSDFIYYLGEIGIDKTLLKPENEIQLLTFIQEKATIYLNKPQKE